MPLYDYECPKCDEDFEAVMTIENRRMAICDKCGDIGKQILVRSTRASGFSIFKAEFYRDLGRNGTFVNNPQELRDACDRNGSRSTYLENGIHRTSPGPDPIGVRGQDPATRNNVREY